VNWAKLYRKHVLANTFLNSYFAVFKPELELIVIPYKKGPAVKKQGHDYGV